MKVCGYFFDILSEGDGDEDDEEEEEEEEEDSPCVLVDIDVSLSAHANARHYYELKKLTAEKREKTLQSGWYFF